jgi:hypothetical protein
VYVSNVLAVSNIHCKCFIWNVVYVAVAIHICYKCMFQMFSCFRNMLQVFYLDVAYVAVAMHICSKSMFQMFHMFQTYVTECFMLQEFSLTGSMRSSSRRACVGMQQQQHAHVGACSPATACVGVPQHLVLRARAAGVACNCSIVGAQQHQTHAGACNRQGM